MTSDLSIPDTFTPAAVQDMMRFALEKGGPEAVASMKELVGLAERMADRDARNQFNAAFATFKQRCPAILRTKRGGASEGGGRLTWLYAPIDEIAKKVNPVLLDLGLSYGWSSEDTGEAVKATCTLRHVAGHAVDATVTIRKAVPNRAQTVSQADGAALSMAMRRALSMVLGIVETEPGDEPPAETITEDQQNDLIALFAQFPKPDDARAKFLGALGVSALAEIPVSRFDAARASVVKRIPK